MENYKDRDFLKIENYKDRELQRSRILRDREFLKSFRFIIIFDNFLS